MLWGRSTEWMSKQSRMLQGSILSEMQLDVFIHFIHYYDDKIEDAPLILT